MIRVQINDSDYLNFLTYRINLKFNAVASSFSLTAPKKILPKILSYSKCKIFHDSHDLILSGVIISENYKIAAEPTISTISGYSLPGVLEDCTIPTELYPLQFDNMSLKEILDKLLPYFGIDYVYNSRVRHDFNKKYKKVTAQPTQTIKDFINKLASQKNIILTHTHRGELDFTKINLDTFLPIAQFEQGKSELIDISLSVNVRSLHNPIQVMRQAGSDKVKGQVELNNPYMQHNRPTSKILSSGDVFDVNKAARMQLNSELQAITFKITTTKLVLPGNIIEVKIPDLEINNFIRLFVQETQISGDAQGEVYSLSCVLPEIYSDKEFKNIFND